MSDYYTITSFAVGVNTQEAWWLRKAYRDAGSASAWYNKQFSEEEVVCNWREFFSMKIRRDYNGEFDVWVTCDQSIGIDAIGAFFQAFILEFRSLWFISFTYAETCSRPLLDSFSGGGVVVTAKKIHYITPTREMAKIQHRLNKKAGVI